MSTKAVRESVVEGHFTTVVKLLGGESRKVQWIGRRSAPDRRGMLPAIVIDDFQVFPALAFWAEFKRPGEWLEDHQAREHARMKRCGEIVHTFNSVEQIDAFFQERLSWSQQQKLSAASE